MDSILQIELLLNLLNTLFGKAMFYKDYATTNELSLIRRRIYYGDCEYNSTLESLKQISTKLNVYK